MKNIFRKNWGHIVVWTLMFLFFISAPRLHSKLFLDQGKPIQFDSDLPKSTPEGQFALMGLDSMRFDGEDVYQLWGWAFLTRDPTVNQIDYERTLVLKSDSHVYFFPITTTPTRNVQETFNTLDLDLTNTWFYTLIAKDFISLGRYRVGIIFEHHTEGTSFYLKTNGVIIRTPNHLVLETK